jgi:flavin reductase (DIM6/NTAB) family NADH-FMN oxidoreductase RutF
MSNIDKTALFKIGYGLYVVTSNDGTKDNGMIVNTVVQLTSNPCMVAVTINKSNYTHDVVKQSGIMNVNCLSVDTPFSVFENFGFKSGRDTEKFLNPSMLTRSDNGIVYIPAGTNAYISGSVVDEFDLGTHTMFIADVVDAEIISDTPSATYDYYHKNIKPAPQKTESKGWRCKICGYVYEGEELPEDFICPLCKHGAADFEKI